MLLKVSLKIATEDITENITENITEILLKIPPTNNTKNVTVLECLITTNASTTLATC